MEKRYAIIDVETTGGSAARHKITEIAIVLHNGKEVLGTFETLLNPECPISYGITELTGITNDMVANAPKFYEVAKQIVQMTEGAIFVAHNVRFDYSFVQEEFRRLGYPFIRKQLCTVRLARKAFPGYHSYSLGHLINILSLKAGERHRAMGDTLATVDLFERIFAKEATAENINHMVNLGVKESLLPKNFTLEKLHSLPEGCGVYYFHDENNDVVYVGKSQNIKKRVAEHFSDKTEKASKLQSLVHDVSWELTGSELVALLIESQEIKRIRPAVNRAQRISQFPFVIHTWLDQLGYRCFDVAKPTVKTRKTLQIVAEYPKVAHAKSWLKSIQRQHELCLRLCHLEEKSGACFDFHLHRCHGACIGQEPPESYNERAEIAFAALDEALPERNFFLLDKGRSDDEKAIILVENGEYRGCGFANVSEMEGDLQELRDVISPAECNPEVKRILRRFLAERGRMKMIRF